MIADRLTEAARDALPVVLALFAVLFAFSAARWAARALEWVLNGLARILGRGR